MAGCPGAGKTEYSEEVVSSFSKKPILIDPDKLRPNIPVYNGRNSSVVQGAISIILERILDDVIRKRKASFILDGTFSSPKSINNVDRVLRHGYAAHIYFLHLRPDIAWGFTVAREVKEGRHINKEVFIDRYVKSIENVQEVKNHFGNKIKLNVIDRDIEYDSKGIKPYYNVDNIVDHVKKVYTHKEIAAMIDEYEVPTN